MCTYSTCINVTCYMYASYLYTMCNREALYMSKMVLSKKGYDFYFLKKNQPLLL